MEIVIIEDEDLAVDRLENMLLKSDFKIVMKQRLESVKTAIEWFNHNTCDLILSDIHLGDGESFEIFESLNIKVPIIFITAHDKFAIEAFKFFAVDYLLKPFQKKDLYAALQKYKSFNIKNDYMDRLESLVGHLKTRDVPNKQRFLVIEGDMLLSIQRSEIAYFMAQDKYLFLVTKSGGSYLYKETISSLEPQLSPKYFFKLNRKYIVQHEAIKKISRYSNNRIRVELAPSLNHDELILVSANNINEFKNWLDQ